MTISSSRVTDGLHVTMSWNARKPSLLRELVIVRFWEPTCPFWPHRLWRVLVHAMLLQKRSPYAFFNLNPLSNLRESYSDRPTESSDLSNPGSRLSLSSSSFLGPVSRERRVLLDSSCRMLYILSWHPCTYFMTWCQSISQSICNSKPLYSFQAKLLPKAWNPKRAWAYSTALKWACFPIGLCLSIFRNLSAANLLIADFAFGRASLPTYGGSQANHHPGQRV